MIRFGSILVLAVIFLLACSKAEDPFFEQNEMIDGKTWSVNDTVKFTFDVEDTNTLYDFYLNLRTTANYEYSNIFVFYKLQFPNNKNLTDTAEFVLAQPNGKWLGRTVSGSLIDNSMLFSKKRRFPLQGKYTFSVIHGMRHQSLDNISDVGFKIIKSSGEK